MIYSDEVKALIFGVYEPCSSFSIRFEVNMKGESWGIEEISVHLKSLEGVYENTNTDEQFIFKYKAGDAEWQVTYDLSFPAIYFQDVDIDFKEKTIHLT